MDGPLDEQYLTWLYSQVGSIKVTNKTRTYWSLFRELYNREFIWFIPNDDNRVEDGKDLRREFIEEYRLDDVDPDWMALGCSVLELLISLSRVLAFEAEGQPRVWFWKLLDNLGLGKYTDAYERSAEQIETTLDRLIWRTYEPNGEGGLFPLKNPSRDQTEVELWYQLSAYVLELG